MCITLLWYNTVPSLPPPPAPVTDTLQSVTTWNCCTFHLRTTVTSSFPHELSRLAFFLSVLMQRAEGGQQRYFSFMLKIKLSIGKKNIDYHVIDRHC